MTTTGRTPYYIYETVHDAYRDLFREKEFLGLIPSASQISEIGCKRANRWDISDRLSIIIFVELAEAVLTSKGTGIPQSMNANTLFKTTENGKEVFVTRLATDSNNRAVVEEKGTGRVFTVEQSALEKVVPYTVGIRFATGGTIYNYLAKKDSVKTGDLLVKKDGSNFATVVKIDTKSDHGTVELSKEFRVIESKEIDG